MRSRRDPVLLARTQRAYAEHPELLTLVSLPRLVGSPAGEVCQNLGHHLIRGLQAKIEELSAEVQKLQAECQEFRHLSKQAEALNAPLTPLEPRGNWLDYPFSEN